MTLIFVKAILIETFVFVLSSFQCVLIFVLRMAISNIFLFPLLYSVESPFFRIPYYSKYRFSKSWYLRTFVYI